MSEEKNKKIYTTCPYTGQAEAWTEEELDNGHWKGTSNANGSIILADSYDGLRLRYGKLTLARLISEESAL